MTRPDDYLWDRSGPADPDVARLEALLAPLAHAAPLREPPPRPPRRTRRWLAAGAACAVAAAAAIAIVLAWPRTTPTPYACAPTATGFAFTARGGGSVGCGGASVPAGVLPVGATLDTGAHAAELAIANIGRAELSPQTRVRLDRTSPERHQLYLERGRMHARVSAPPRLFAVATPGAHVTDLGCEYTLDIDESGAGSIAVQSGMVELETGTGGILVVPRGTHARLLAGRRAGLPLIDGASPALTAAAAEFERTGAIPPVLDAATDDDAITIAGLAVLAPAPERRAVLVRLAQLYRITPGRTVDEALAERAVLDPWLDEIVRFTMARAAMPWTH